MRARTWYSRPSSLLTYETPLARPRSLTLTSRAMALGMMRNNPVSRAGGNNTVGEEKFDAVPQPRLHCPQ